MKQTVIALVKPAVEPIESWQTWCDGLYGALKILAQESSFKVYVMGLSDTPTTLERDGITFFLRRDSKGLKYAIDIHNPKYIFGWGTSFYNWPELESTSARKILLYAGGQYDFENASRVFDHIVVENPSDQIHFPGSTIAFGTNTEIFRPIDMYYAKNFPCIFPSAFARWKRQELWAKVAPIGSLAIGQFQEHEKDCYEVCVENGHIVIPQVPMNILPYFYNQSVGTLLTAEHMGGCQRASLESMACNVPVLTTSDSKASEFNGVWSASPIENELREAYTTMCVTFSQNPVNLREEFIVGKLDHITYATKLKELL